MYQKNKNYKMICQHKIFDLLSKLYQCHINWNETEEDIKQHILFENEIKSTVNNNN